MAQVENTNQDLKLITITLTQNEVLEIISWGSALKDVPISEALLAQLEKMYNRLTKP